MKSASSAAPLPSLPPGARVAALVSSYHGELCRKMLGSARRTLEACGLAAGHLRVLEVPGAYELPIVARRLAARDDVDAVLCFGLVLRGSTDHDRYISNAVATRLLDVSFETDTPVLFGVLTPNTVEQAKERARLAEEGGLDKGREVALAAVHVLNALQTAEQDFEQLPTHAGGEDR
jgi:6,7-dimethyl-8-ribityllumazine synthase